MSSRERFEQWLPPAMNFCEQTCAWMAWQAAERETAKAAVDCIHSYSTVCDRSAEMIAAIKAEFPGAWE